MRIQKVLFLIYCFFSVFDVSGQSPRFYLQTDRTTVATGETFVLEAILENIDSKTIDISDVSPFKIVQGPSTSTSITIINGKRTASLSLQYVLLATQKGSFKIPPATTKLGSKVLKSNELTIQVTEGTSTSVTGTIETKGETFVRLEIADTKGYIGQQVTLDYVLYTRQNIESYNIINEPDLEGFYVQPLNDIRDQPQRKIINGKEYYTQVVRRQILFPQKTGNYKIGPVNISIDIPLENGRTSFFFRETRKENITTNALKLSVIDLPETEPMSFSGGVGNFEMKAAIQKTSVAKGEAIVLQMQIDGDGDPKIIKAPNFKIPDGLEKYEPATTKDETMVMGDKIRVHKVFEYIYVPSKDTIFTIIPEFTYLSPSTGKYETIKAGPFNIQVSKSALQSMDDNNLHSGPDYSSYISKDTRFFSLKDSQWLSFWHIGSVAFISLFTFLGIFFKKQKISKIQLDEINQAKAGSIAKQNLQSAFNFKNQNEVRAFFEEIALATTGYILKKYNIPNTDASSTDIVNHLKNHHLSQDIISKYEQIQKKCELARFAGHFEDMVSIYSDAEWMIDEMEG